METRIDAMGRLPQLGLLRFSGKEAASFLQGQLANDTLRLSGGQTVLAASSTPQGRVAAILRLLPHSSGIVAILPREIVLPTLERLRKFVLRTQVRIEDVGDQLDLVGVRGVGALRALGLDAPQAGSDYIEHDALGVARVGVARVGAAHAGAAPAEVDAGERYWVIGSGAQFQRQGFQPTDAAVFDEPTWRLDDIRDGSPQVYAATREMFVAQMLNLDLIDGISFSKGCYTGQEIIARTQHLGRIKRRLYRLRLPAGTWAVGQSIDLRDGRSGRLTEIAPTEEGYEALAVLPVDLGAGGASDTDTQLGGSGETVPVDATVLSLPYALTPAH